MAVEPQVALPVEFVDFDGTPGSGTPFDAAHMNPNVQALRDVVNEHTHLVGDARDAPVGDGLWERSGGGMVLRDPASFVGSDDARLTDARVPLAHSASHLGGGDDLLPTLDSRYAGVAAAVSKSLITTKGDLIVGTGAGAVARLGAGPNGDIPVADSTQASGLRWDTPANALGGSLPPAGSPLDLALAPNLDVATTEDLYASARFGSVEGGVTISVTTQVPILVAQHRIRVISAALMLFNSAVVANDTNYWTAQILAWTAGSSRTIATKTTKATGNSVNEAITQRKGWLFDNTFFPTSGGVPNGNEILEPGDGLDLLLTPTGAPTALNNGVFTVRYEPI